MLLGLAVLLGLAAGGCVTAGAFGGWRGVSYSRIVRRSPRPLRIHVLRIDLDRPDLELAVAIAPDPDGEGPAETVLRPPTDHFVDLSFVAGVNANAWRMLPTEPGGEAPDFVAGGACDVAGWVIAGGQTRSEPKGGNWSFWLDPGGAPHLGNVSVPTNASVAIAGFGGLLRDGKVLPRPSEQRHPRTALGFDQARRRLILAVVDGRQPGFSEGMSDHELAELMRELGCWEALNLDGGGSSIMILRGKDGEPRIANRPSDWDGPRPIPVFFGVRSR